MRTTYLAKVRLAACHVQHGKYAEGQQFEKRMVSDNKDNLAIANQVARLFPEHTIKSIRWS